MKMGKLGAHGPLVSSIGLGCMGMSEFYGPADDAAAIAVLHHALSLGINFFDSSDMYGPYTNEKLLGKAFSGIRDQAVIATKFGIVRDEGGGWHGISGRPAYVRSACEASLKRLGTDYIDLYYQHRVDPQVPIEETIGAMAELVQAGKVRFLGLSEANPTTLRRAHQEHRVTALQTEYSLWSRDPEDGGHLATCAELGIAYVAYSPLGRGFLSGQIRSPEDLAPDDFRRVSPRFMGENFARNLSVVRRIEDLAQARGCTSAQLALAWVLGRGRHVLPIPGTTKIARLEENAAAVEMTLTPVELALLEDAAPKGFAAGERYDEQRMPMLNL
ncbi:MAG: aldo/keto reductase [Gammaproteobacteria bacterium]|nr:aldo/keto reductase [Gammaproteobacteria bacterium]